MATILLLVPIAGCIAQDPDGRTPIDKTGPSDSDDPSADDPVTPVSRLAAVDLGEIVNASILGLEAERDDFGTSDPSVLVLPDGRVRIYYNVAGLKYPNNEVGTVISDDGFTFVHEQRGPPPPDTGSRVIQVNETTWAHADPAPSIHTSTDGLNWTLFAWGTGKEQPGVVPMSTYNATQVTNQVGIVKLPDGLFRLYMNAIPCGDTDPYGRETCSIAPPQAAHPEQSISIVSATSHDLLDWTPDPGVRLGLATGLDYSVRAPAVKIGPDGRVHLFVWAGAIHGPEGFRGDPEDHVDTVEEWASDDGLVFEKVLRFGLPGAHESDGWYTDDGDLRLVFGVRDNERGESGIRLATLRDVAWDAVLRRGERMDGWTTFEVDVLGEGHITASVRSDEARWEPGKLSTDVVTVQPPELDAPGTIKVRVKNELFPGPWLFLHDQENALWTGRLALE